MGNLTSSLKRFISNKNTVTILMVLLGVFVLYFGYNYRVKEAITPVSVPYAKVDIASRTKITDDMIGYTDIPRSFINKNKNLIQNTQLIVGKVVNFANTIPANSFFYTTAITEEDLLPGNSYKNLGENERVLKIDVNNDLTLGNSIYPGTYIDLYAKTKNETDQIVYTNFVSGLEVKQVKDRNGLHVFETAVELREPAYLIFYVQKETHELLEKAKELNIELIPIPRHASYSPDEGDQETTSEYVRRLIDSQSASVDVIE